MQIGDWGLLALHELPRTISMNRDAPRALSQESHGIGDPRCSPSLTAALDDRALHCK